MFLLGQSKIVHVSVRVPPIQPDEHDFLTLAGCSRSIDRRITQTTQNAAATEVVQRSVRYPYWGYEKIFALNDRDRLGIGRERVRLIRRREGRRYKRRLLGRWTQWVCRATPQLGGAKTLPG